MSELVGQTILRYKILEKIGQGGMGVVYKAVDTKLKREVAIKFLPQNIAINKEERKRFEIEAQAAASLNHPNITTIYSIEETDNEFFIVMEYIEGIELKERLKSGIISPDEATNIAIQIAEGLKAAHIKGIIHRDIKSSNIMLTDSGIVKIMDFGLAKIKGGSELTKIGTTVGTIAYMSPEQARGEKVDKRTDIWSFGIVLYEMLTRELPFKGEYDQVIIYSIMNLEPETLSKKLQNKEPVSWNEIYQNLEKIVFKSLAKDINQRYQQAEDLLAQLKKIHSKIETTQTTPITSTPRIFEDKSDITRQGKKVSWFDNKKGLTISVSTTVLITLIILSYLFLFNKGSSDNTTSTFKKSIAVLPFENLSSDKNNAYFASGTEDMILTKLAGIGGLKVISRTSTDRYKSQPEDLKTVAKQLGVATVLEGSVQKSNNEVLINVQLIDAKTDSHIWAKAYTRTLDNVFTVEGEVAGKIAQALQIKLIPQEAKDLHSKPTNNSQAYDLFLKAKYQIYLYNKLGKVPINALKLYHRAIALDTTFALAYAGLSGAEQIMYELKNYNDSLLTQALLHANHAVRIDSGLAEGYFQLGSIYATKGEYKKAKTEFDKTLKISPNDPHVLSVLAMVDGYNEGLWDDALEYIKKATVLDPQNINTLNNYSAIELLLGNYEKSVKIGNRTLGIDPDNIDVTRTVALSLIFSGHLEQARNILKQRREIFAAGASIIYFDRAQIYLNRYDHKFNLALAFADSLKIEIKKLGRRYYGIALYNFELGQSLSWAGYANANMDDKINMKRNIKKAIKLLSITPNNEDVDVKFTRLTFLALDQAYYGLREAAISTMKKVLTREPIDHCYNCHYFHLTILAQIYALYKEPDNAIPILKKVVAAKGTGRSISKFLLKNDPGWDPIRSDPRFQEIVHKYSDKNQQM